MPFSPAYFAFTLITFFKYINSLFVLNFLYTRNLTLYLKKNRFTFFHIECDIMYQTRFNFINMF